MLVVNWNNFVTKNMPRKNRTSQIEKFYECTCPTCGGQYFLRRADIQRAQRRNSACKACRLHTLAATFRKHLNQPEQRVFTWLQDFEVPFVSQSVLMIGQHGFIVDFLAESLIIEIDGAYFHAQEPRAARDRKLESLWHGSILHLDATTIMRDPTRARDQLEVALLTTPR